MNKSSKQILQVASVYIGTVIGAGFASGQEMIQFFTSYGIKGVGGLILAGILYAIIGAVVLELIYEKKYISYGQLLNEVMGEKLGRTLEIVVNMFLFVCFSAMIAGAGAIIKQDFGVSTQIGSIIMVVLCIITFFTGTKGFVNVNSILVPILCIGGIILGSYIIIFRDVSAFASSMPKIKGDWILAAVLYVCYNLLTVIVILPTMYQILSKKKVATWGGILGGMGLGVLGLSIGLSTLIYYNEVNGLEIPMLGILMNYSKILKYIYMVVLIAAMYTTAIANGYGVIENLTRSFKMKKSIVILGVSLLGYLGSQLGFSNIVANIFPIFGYIGCFEIIMIMVYYGCMKIERRRKGIEHR